MTGVVLGALAFFVVVWVDAVSLKSLRFLKPVLWLAGIALFAAGVVLAARQPPRVELPLLVSAAGWAVAGFFSLLLFYSLFLEIPFVSAYVRRGRPARPVTSGTYALCRHPGVLWLAGAVAGLFVATRGLWLLVGLPVWVALDVLYAFLQERLFFARMFGTEYENYRRAVPMLLPTSRSIHECARTIFRRGAS
jgi:protein-S-isoprenylcysteine O-methyltransferase Ste14